MRVKVIRAFQDYQVDSIIDIQPNQLQPLSTMNYVRVLTADEVKLDAEKAEQKSIERAANRAMRSPVTKAKKR